MSGMEFEEVDEAALSMQHEIRSIIVKYSDSVDLITMLATFSAIQGNLLGQLEAQAYDLQGASEIIERNVNLGIDSVRAYLGAGTRQ